MINWSKDFFFFDRAINLHFGGGAKPVSLPGLEERKEKSVVLGDLPNLI